MVQEQFTKSWNAFTDYETLLSQDDTAGRFGWWTNLYQMGVVSNDSQLESYNLAILCSD